MGIKEAIARKKLASTNTSEVMLPLMMEEVYKRIKSLTDAQFDDYQGELEKRVKEVAFSLEQYCRKAESDMAKLEQEAVARINQISNESKVDVSDFLAGIKETTDKSLATIASEMLQKADKVVARLEKMRGPQGVPGTQGTPGKPGKDGSPDTAEQVVAKVNKAKGVKMTAIDGLEDELKKVKKATGGGGKSGGGMGNVYHETKAVSSGTTSVTTTYPIAAGGRACWLFYQGQFLIYSTHYTVNGNLITLTFDKVDSTFIDITYIR